MRSFKPEECIAALNTLKEGYQIKGGHITKKEILTGLHNCGLPTNPIFWGTLRKFGIIQETGLGKYVFVGKDPIYVGKLRAIQNLYLKTVHKYYPKKAKPISESISESTSETNAKPISEISSESVPELVTVTISEEQAINFLKERGYKIYKYVEL